MADRLPCRHETRIAVISVVALLLGACSCPGGTVAKPKHGTWAVDLSDMDKSVRPGDNFYRYFAGSWMKTAQIRPDLSSEDRVHIW
jgi:hypothetical protein